MHRAENGQCVLDNTQTCTTTQINGSPAYLKLSIVIELAEKMKWIKMGTLHNGQPGYVLGPNLRKDFPTNEVPTATDLAIPKNNSGEFFTRSTRMPCISALSSIWCFWISIEVTSKRLDAIAVLCMCTRMWVRVW